ncbi:uncharacterized protein LOC105700893 [Orussus abietinus]|uniref:uncharacterized protein LOC105700893 n=1 Tax=Orussus abietinus TaxID=222816 RepID=UPI0006251823|nr:uncharacterized protein LOC105700893 [Orussus abietinus]
MGVALLLMVLAVVETTRGAEEHALRRSSAPGLDDFDFLAYSRKYDKDPVVFSKRATILWDNLMVTLKKALNDQGLSGGGGGERSISRAPSHGPVSGSRIVPAADGQTMDLQRRGQARGSVYWRCYFNAVSCFKRK